MKKAKKRKARPPKRKRRPKAKPEPKRKARPEARHGQSAQSAFPSNFDFAEPAAATLDRSLLVRATNALGEGDLGTTLTLCRQALAVDSKNADALNLAGIVAFQSGQAEESLDLLKTAVAFAPGHAEAQTNLGNVLAALGRTEDAAAAYQVAIDNNPEYAEAWFNFGVVLEASGRTANALAAFERCLELDVHHAGARHGLGNVLKALGRLDAARENFERAVELKPGLPETRTNLAAVLQELGDFTGAADHCRQVLKVMPDNLEARYNLGIALQELGDFEAAIDAYERVLLSEPGHAAAALNIGYGLQQMSRLDDAAAAFERTLAIDPDFAKATTNLADVRLEQGDPEKALTVCDAFLDRHSGNIEILAFKALALWDLGQKEDARQLVDFDRFLRSIHIAAPSGYDDLAAFNAVLAAHVEAHPTLTYAPQSHATRKGRHSGELLNDPRGPIAELEKAIRKAADSYQKDLGRDPDHPFLAAPPEHLTLSVWGVVLEASGHQIPHIHPAAWLSGVYYPKLPDVIGATDSDKSGWIEFGRAPYHFHNRARLETRSIRPEPGLMVLFPSFFYHHTVPFKADGTRVSIAFDLMPKTQPHN